MTRSGTARTASSRSSLRRHREVCLIQRGVTQRISATGRDVRELRERLDLDSGYLSRLLRGPERDGLVRVEPSAADGRVRTARLTAAGQAERAELGQLSDAAAAELLAPLSGGQRPGSSPRRPRSSGS
ncbi:hypothetical protein Amsp01_065610 [Amycolatopsis sp. NBRC 101858]|uniref:MarR family winged helix-turn-helix transcriptional regulator n=1 Tax=Amycolatopsis sp. NBRC 101858 TaxID=3032200 RepID=UPI0024A269D7|nr:MarR family winged helix-turn-helix transcriptional regulator [Amycolatopsis sp. NBRC 101858]GLY40538.1 hypothetical protein Amsp01_065610 [Amycolatopsis sp. NBRC 101858]